MAYVPMQGPMAVAPQPAVTMIPAPVRIPKANKKVKYARNLYGFGITELVLGCTAFLLCVISIIIAATSYRYYYGVITYIASGIWGGIFLIISGILGVLTRKKPTVCMYNANMVMAIICAVMMATMFGISVPAAVISYKGSLIFIHSLQSLISFAGMIICIIHSAYCCAGVCGGHSYQGQVMYPVQGQQFVQLANGQYMMVQGQPLIGQPMTSIPSSGAPVTEPLQPGPTFNPTTSAGYTPAPMEPEKQPGNLVEPTLEATGASLPPSYDGHNFQQHS